MPLWIKTKKMNFGMHQKHKIPDAILNAGLLFRRVRPIRAMGIFIIPLQRSCGKFLILSQIVRVCKAQSSFKQNTSNYLSS